MADDVTAKTVPPLPYKTPLINNSGFLTEPWAKFFRQMFIRVGGNVALSNSELEALPTVELGTTNTNVAALQAAVGALQLADTLFQGKLNDLNQGPVL